MMQDTVPYLIVIPYLASGAEADELGMAIAGWRRHFREPYKIVVAGDGLPCIEGDDVVCIESPRVNGTEGMYRQHLDYVSCFRKVRAQFPEHEGFIFVADDCYLVKDCTIDDIRVLKARSPKIQASPYDLGWLKDKFRTLMQLIEDGLPYVDYSSHLPQWFEWDKLLALYDRYHMDDNSFVFEDLYYNTYHKDEKPVILDCTGAPYASFVNSNELERMKQQVDKGMNECMWVQNIAGRYTAYLQKRLMEHYGLLR